jgi:hypothetical protein
MDVEVPAQVPVGHKALLAHVCVCGAVSKLVFRLLYRCTAA